MFLAVIFVFTLGNSTDAFLLLRARQLGVPVALAPILWALLNGVKSVSNVPGGALSDRIGRRPTLVAGWIVYAAVYFLFARATHSWHAWALFAAYGLFFGLTEGTELRARGGRRAGRAHAVRRTVGTTSRSASARCRRRSLFGVLWDRFGSGTAFTVGAALALAAALAMAVSRSRACPRRGSAAARLPGRLYRSSMPLPRELFARKGCYPDGIPHVRHVAFVVGRADHTAHEAERASGAVAATIGFMRGASAPVLGGQSVDATELARVRGDDRRVRRQRGRRDDEIVRADRAVARRFSDARVLPPRRAD